MPKLIKDGAIANDEWVLIESAEVEGALPSGNLIVPLALWAAQQEQLLAEMKKWVFGYKAMNHQIKLVIDCANWR